MMTVWETVQEMLLPPRRPKNIAKWYKQGWYFLKKRLRFLKRKSEKIFKKEEGKVKNEERKKERSENRTNC